jgi:hypothetical protein
VKPAPVAERVAAWVKDEPFGVEFANITLPPGLRAEVVAIGVNPMPYRLDYILETAAGLVASRLRVATRGDGWRRSVDLRRGEDGAWTIEADHDGRVDLPPPGGDPAPLNGSLDVDVARSPVTNTVPILRHGLVDGGGPIELTVAWVSVPDLGIHADGQRYNFIRADGDGPVIRFEAVDGTFAADISLDPDGIVLDYPGIARRLPGRPGR